MTRPKRNRKKGEKEREGQFDAKRNIWSYKTGASLHDRTIVRIRVKKTGRKKRQKEGNER